MQIKLFKLNKGALEERKSTNFDLEKQLQNLIESNMQSLFGITFLKTEHSTGKERGHRRIDSLGIDENNCPVIVEYKVEHKPSSSGDIITQALAYLNWLMDHKAEFKLLVKTLDEKCADKDKKRADKIDWANPRLLCIAPDFSKYADAVKQIDRDIDLIRYRKYDDDVFLIELVNAKAVKKTQAAIRSVDNSDKTSKKTPKQKTHSEFLEKADGSLKNLYHEVESFIRQLGDEVQEKELKHYKAFKRIKNFACLEIKLRGTKPKGKHILLLLGLDPEKIKDFKNGLISDVRGKGHFGTGDVALQISSADELEQAKDLIKKSYEAN